MNNTSTTILTIDDESNIRYIFKLFLEEKGFRVLEAENGKDGLEIFAREKPDLLLLDLNMPVVSGLEVLKKVILDAPDVPVIVCSGATEMDDIIEAIRNGAWDYINKPLHDLAVLDHAVTKALERKQLLQENKNYQNYLEQEIIKRTSEIETANRKLTEEVREHQATEALLKDSMAYLENIFNSSLDSIIVGDSTGQIIMVNQSLCNLLGYTEKEILGKNPVDLSYTDEGLHESVTGEQIRIDEDYFKIGSEMTTELFEKGSIRNWEFYFIRKDKRLTPIELNIVFLKNDAGERSGSLAIIRDITERRRTKNEILALNTELEQRVKDRTTELANSNKQLSIFKKFAEESFVGLGMSDLQGNIVYFNPALSNMIGYTTADEASTQNIFDFYPPQHQHELQESILPAIIKQGRWNGELSLVTSSGNTVCTSHDLFIIYDETNSPLYLAGLIADITHRKQAELAIREAIDKAEAATLAKSEFLASMSHEIRTPMNGIIGMSDLLQSTELTSQQRGYAGIINTSSLHLLQIINDILDISKIEAGKLDIETIDFNLRKTCESVSDAIALRAYEKGLEYTCRFNHDIPSLLRGDPGRIRQILLNLIGNAIKFTTSGSISVIISLKSLKTENILLRFEVEDTGIGIPPEMTEKIFETFTQADASTTRTFGGTGLGLTICKRLINMLGGSLGVVSAVGKGSLFWFELPFKKQVAKQPVETVSNNELEHRPILIVDSSRTSRLVLTEQLMSLNLNSSEAQNGSEALRLMQKEAHAENHFWAAIIDKQLADMDTHTFTKSIKADPKLQGTHLIMLTSLGERGDAHSCKENGFDAYLIKPVKQTLLHECLISISGIAVQNKTGSEAPLITQHSIAEAKKSTAEILLVEDNVTNQIVACGILERLGYQAEIACNGREAIAAFKKKPFDIIFMDVQMPEMDGIEATKGIRIEELNNKGEAQNKNYNSQMIPIVAMTASAMPDDRKRCIDAGMNDYMTKPINPNELASMLERYLPSAPACVPAPTTRNQPPTQKSVNTALLDLDKLHERLDDNELVTAVIKSFKEYFPVYLNDLKAAIAAKDVADIVHRAHTIKGSAANAEACSIKTIAAEIESAGKKHNLQKALKMISPLEKEFDKFKKQITM
ncbi:MAG: response regulator [Deltaproteobacteria bacterium]|nr:response regulator [Deltaproteobacteria bacterium]